MQPSTVTAEAFSGIVRRKAGLLMLTTLDNGDLRVSIAAFILAAATLLLYCAKDELTDEDMLRMFKLGILDARDELEAFRQYEEGQPDAAQHGLDRRVDLNEDAMRMLLAQSKVGQA